jgi:hypothetical protein
MNENAAQTCAEVVEAKPANARELDGIANLSGNL